MNTSGENLPSTSDASCPGPAATEEASAQIAAALATARTAEACVTLAARAEQSGDLDLLRRCLGQAVALDRDCQPALLMLAAQAMDDGDAPATFAFLEEAARGPGLPAEVTELHRELAGQMSGDARLEHYLQVTGRRGVGRAEKPLTILLVTNLFPPQELGGYGRMMWEFAHGLIARGHTVRVLTAHLPALAKEPVAEEVALEAHVHRTLQLSGTWVGGKAVPLTDREEAVRRMRDNAARIRTAAAKLKPDLVLAGNLDFLGLPVLRAALDHDLPVLHALANAAPGYPVAGQPPDARYWVAPCSDWNGEVFGRLGYVPARLCTLYPGARVDRFFRLFLPDTSRLRLCYASLMLPYKGADTLVAALGRLHAAGVDFTAEIAGEAPDAAFLAAMQEQVRHLGLADKVRFTGFLDRRGLSALFARSNVLVFPSKFEEPFGISQVEALAAGLIVVSSGTGGAKEIIRHGVDGLLFAAGNDADLAAKLTQVAGDPALAAKLQRNGQARAAVFSVDHAVRQIETLAAGLATAGTVEPALPDYLPAPLDRSVCA